MSWKICVLSLPPEIDTIEQVHDILDSLPPLGTYSYVIEVIKSVWPSLEEGPLHDGYYRVETEDYNIDFVLTEPIGPGLCFSPHGGGDYITPLRLLCERTGCRAMDSSTGELLNFDAYLGTS